MNSIFFLIHKNFICLSYGKWQYSLVDLVIDENH